MSPDARFGDHSESRPKKRRAREWRRFARALSATLAIGMAAASPGSAAIIGWQTFSNCGAHNDTGVCDGTPDSNSTWDASPAGSVGPAGTYLSGAIGTQASALGRTGRGQQANNAFLNGPGFGNESATDPLDRRLIENVPLADGSPGVRIGPQGSATQGAPDGTSSWKFSTNDTARSGDVRITNESDYWFRLEFVHFDARVGNANSPRRLEIDSLSGDGTAFDNVLTRFDDGTEVANLYALYDNDFGPGPATFNVSQSVGGALATQAYLPPGASAAFRFSWSNHATQFAESQIDNLAFEGRFFDSADLSNEIDPTAVSRVPVTYYVSESVGDDGNVGLSESEPLQTLDRVNALGLQPGDRVLFRSGDIWRGMLWPKGSGTTLLPIELGAYGNGDRPVIDGDGYQASVLLVDVDHYQIDGLELTNQAPHLDDLGAAKTEPGFSGAANDQGTGENVRFGLKIVASTRSLNGFALSNLDIHDVFPTPSNVGNQHKGYGVKFESQSDASTSTFHTISQVSMDTLNVRRTGHYGVWIRPLGLDGIDDHKHDAFTLRNSSFLDTGGSGFVAAKASNVLVEDNVFDGTGSHLDPRMWMRGSGLWTFDARDVLIQRNVVRRARGTLDSYGVHIDYNNENVVVQQNYSYDNEGGFAQILGGNLDCGYRFNISVADGRRIEGVDGALQNGRIFNVSDYCNVPGGCPSVGNFIHNNTVYVPNDISPEIFIKAGSGETRIYNNVIVAEAGGPALETHMATSGVTYDVTDNLFHPAASFLLESPLTNGAHFADPLLRMPGADDPAMYKLLPGSPAKSVGALVSAGADYFGFSVPDDSAPHLGAYNGNEFFGPVAVPGMTALARGLVLILLLGLGAGLARPR